jgi:hypothetical protein
MIPALLIVGLVNGFLPRPWLYVALAAVAWPLVLLITHVTSGLDSLLTASALATANTTVGALCGWALRTAFSRIDRKLR